jgi:hypothetical protein
VSRSAVRLVLLVALLAGCAPSSPDHTGAGSSEVASVTAAPSSVPVATPRPVACPEQEQDLPTSESDDLARPAVVAVLDLFADAPVVAIGEYHGWEAQHAFFAALVCDRRFPEIVDTIVVEFANPRLQPIIDRYVGGESVSSVELASVWRESTQRSGVWEHPVYERFFGLVRVVNAGLPADARIRLLAGDVPIDWADVGESPDCSSDRPACVEEPLYGRDEAFAGVVADEVLASGETALLIAGAGHMARRFGDGPPPAIPQLIEAEWPGSTRVVLPHRGFGAVDAASERRIAALPAPSLVILDETWIGELDACLVDGGEGQDQVCPDGQGPTIADMADAYLLLGG